MWEKERERILLLSISALTVEALHLFKQATSETNPTCLSAWLLSPDEYKIERPWALALIN